MLNNVNWYVAGPGRAGQRLHAAIAPAAKCQNH